MTDATAPPGLAAARQPLFSEGYKRGVLTILTLVYTLNFIDRTILGTIGQPVKESLGITDNQLGLLTGLAFAILYTALGVPIARLAERFSRVNIMAVCVTIWSAFTALCGLAPNFATLMAFRVGVGVGEAGCSPPAHSLISDYFEPKKRASALSVYAFGIPLGSMFGAIFGGLIAQYLNWRLAFFIVGVPGVLVALALKAFVKEPPRGHADIEAHPATSEDVTPEEVPAAARMSFGQEMAHEARELLHVGRTLFGTWGFLNMILGITLCSFAGYGIGQFSSPYFIRTFGLGLAVVGVVFGLIGGASTGLGTLVGGFVTDWANRRSPAWYGLVPGIGLAIAVPLYAVVYTRADWRVAGALSLIPGVFHYFYLGPTFGVIQNAVEVRRRATATALTFFFLNLIALGGGPPFVGWLIDQFAQYGFAHPGPHGLVQGLKDMTFHGGADGSSFRDLCPGGLPKKGADPALTAACKPVLAQATREGILVSLGFHAWAAVHYGLAALTLPRDLKRAAERMAASRA
ncbi:MAG TPA: MFS transporter [Caulobacteraceae bacterium]|nr:MFS transporter [Caulobacteraceae bacterium]